jgi:hypothetical protein
MAAADHDDSPQRVQARAHLRRGARPAKAPQWVAHRAFLLEAIPLFDLEPSTTPETAPEQR